ncbi:MAG: hypothetical protein Q9160_003434 [Pyrenula sp. 1 TL-2023]
MDGLLPTYIAHGPSITNLRPDDEDANYRARQAPERSNRPATVVQSKYFDPLKISPFQPAASKAVEDALDSTAGGIRIDDVSSGTSESLGRQSGKRSLLNSLKKGIERFQKRTDFVEIVKDGRDTVMTVGQNFGVKNPGSLCGGCSKIPFDHRDPPQGKASITEGHGDEATFYMPIEKILSQRHWCLKNKSFEQWATETPEWKRMVEGVGNKFGLLEDNWPFGSSRDQRETAEAAAQVVRNFQDEEGSIDDGQTALEDALRQGGSDPIIGAAWAGSLGLGVAEGVVADNKNVGSEAKHIIHAAEMATNQLAIFSALNSRPMTCWFVVRAFRRSHPRAGQFTVRVFGHGRAPRAPLSLLCRFKLRFERTREIRTDFTNNGQIWYAQRLRPFIDLPFFGECLVRCEKLHGRACNETKSAVSAPNLLTEPPKPFRVIDVKNWQIAEFGFERPEYIALSFCWGKGTDRHCELREQNKAKLLKPQGLKGESLPQTFQDAMTVVDQIGAQYLWIDRLCIVQDDSKEGGDKEHQIAQMDRIYGEALFTIVAADGKTANAGLVGVSQSRSFKQVIEDVKPDDIALRWLSLERQASPQVSVAKLEEDGSGRIFRPVAFSEYAEAVSQYSSRTMTYPTDILPAFQGLQRTFESGNLGSAFRYGIPERFIDIALLWQPDIPIERREPESFGRPLPSWSWAGWNGTQKGTHPSDRVYGVKGAKVSYQEPFDVCTNDYGALVQRLGDAQDERIRPMLRWFAVTTLTGKAPAPAQSSLVTLGKADTHLKRPPPKPPAKSHLHSSSASSLSQSLLSSQLKVLVEIESFRRQASQPEPAPTVSDHLSNHLDDRHLVFQSEGAIMLVGPSCHRRRKFWTKSGAISLKEQLEMAPDGNESLLLNSRRDSIGIIRLHGESSPRESSRIQTVVLSGAQFIGTE